MEEITKHTEQGQLLYDIRQIIEQGRRAAYAAASQIAVATYWNIGRRIVEEEQKGAARAQYGKALIKNLAEELTHEYGAGFSDRNLRNFRQFYLCFSDFEIWHTRVPNLEWSKVRRVLSVSSPEARLWYLEEASKCNWSYKTLDRNISTQYYERRLAAQREGEDFCLLPFNEQDPTEYIKSPVVAEFLGFRQYTKYTESRVENPHAHASRRGAAGYVRPYV